MNNHEYYLKNREHIIETVRKYRLNHPNIEKSEKRNKYKTLYRFLNKEHYKQIIKEWRKNNRNKLNEYSMIDHYKNKLKYSIRAKTNRFNKRDSKCNLCFSDYRLQFHHLDYKNNIFITLCNVCHKQVHLGNISILRCKA